MKDLKARWNTKRGAGELIFKKKFWFCFWIIDVSTRMLTQLYIIIYVHDYFLSPLIGSLTSFYSSLWKKVFLYWFAPHLTTISSERSFLLIFHYFSHKYTLKLMKPTAQYFRFDLRRDIVSSGLNRTYSTSCLCQNSLSTHILITLGLDEEFS